MSHNPRYGPSRGVGARRGSLARLGAILLAVWSSLWIAGWAAREIGEGYFERSLSLPRPFTSAQLRDIRAVAPEAARLAEMQVRAWERQESLGRELAGAEGELIGTLAAVIAWVYWMLVTLARLKAARGRLVESSRAVESRGPLPGRRRLACPRHLHDLPVSVRGPDELQADRQLPTRPARRAPGR